ncbi:MAG TPA: alcohol dehydrogenase catalytic domain-containing protein [Thermoanaerobaculia bacterium]|nr:alcohol dehydrogenase catalytic domain-containing protein [Thermoanaerobaculia bacterium]
MQAVIKSSSLDGVEGTRVTECPQPVPGPGEVVIRVGAAAICGTDKHIYHWDPSIRDSIHPPRIYGHEFCGFVEAVGERPGRADLEKGSYVSAEMHVVCGVCAQCRAGNGHICERTKILGLHEDGSFAEFVKVPASNVIPLDARYVPLHVGAFLDALGNAVHATQVVDLAGRSVAVTGFGPIGAMSAAIAEHSGAQMIVVTDVSDQALDTARQWARTRNFPNLLALNVRSTTQEEARELVMRETGGGVDVVLEMSGAPSAINLGLDIVRMGGFISLLGLPSGHSLTIDDYTRNVIFKGITMQGIIGRRMYGTWQRMLGLLRSGLDVDWIVQARYDSLEAFHEGMGQFDRHEALKVVFFPEGEEAAGRRLREAE